MGTRTQDLTADAYRRLADRLEREPGRWRDPTLCDGWQVRHLIAHLTMPARMDAAAFGAELAAAGGDFQRLSDTVAARDGELPVDDLLDALRSERLAGWTPPGGGETGALIHVVVHSLDVTLADGSTPTPSSAAVLAVLDLLVGGAAERFGVRVTGRRWRATDEDWSSGDGAEEVTGRAAELVALLSNRTLPDGRHLTAATDTEPA